MLKTAVVQCVDPAATGNPRRFSSRTLPCERWCSGEGGSSSSGFFYQPDFSQAAYTRAEVICGFQPACGGCNLHAVNFACIVLNFVANQSASQSLSAVVHSKSYELVQLTSRTSMKTVKDLAISMNPLHF